LRSNHADVRHHAAVLVLADVAVINEVSHFGERNSHHDTLDRALSRAPRVHRAVARLAAIGQNHVIHQRSGIACGRILWNHVKLGLVDVKVVRLGRQVH